MRTYTTGEARESFAEVVNLAAFGKERVVLSKHGKTVAAVVPICDLQLLQELERIIDVEEARKALAAGDDEGFVALDDLKKELGLK